MLFSKSSVLLFISIVASLSNALTTPHAPRNIHHRAIAHRAASPLSQHVTPSTIRRRADGKRCKARPVSSSSSLVIPSPTLSTTKERPTTTKERPQEPSTTPSPPKPSPTPPPAPSPEPKPTTEKPPATTKAPSSGGGGGNNSGPSFMIGTQTGQGTFYDTGLGACGIVNKDTDYIAAVSHLLFDRFPGYVGGNPNNNPICGRQVRVTYEGKSITVAITDRCEGCAVTDLDFSPSAFSALAAFSVGRISNMKWVWV